MTTDRERFLARSLVKRAPGRAARTVTAAAGAPITHTGFTDALISALGASGRCNICGRKLTDPESVARGTGSDCNKKNGASVVERFIEAARARLKEPTR